MTEASVDSAVRELHEKYASARARQKKFKQISRILTLVFLGVIFGYFFLLYGKVRAQYHPANFEKPLEMRAQELLPVLQPQVEQLVNEVTPVYAEMARTKMQDALPDLEAASAREKDIFLENVRRQGENRLNASLDRISKSHEEKVRKYFPKLLTPEGSEEFGQRWKARIEKDSGDILLHFHDLYTTDIAILEATLERFRPNHFEDMEEEELTRYFLHLWLVRLDRLVWLGDEGEGLFPFEMREKITDED